MLLAIILVLGAVWSFFIAARPDVGFFLEEGWKFRDAEPSDLYLGVTRFGSAAVGIACLVFAAILAFGGPGGGASESDESPSGTASSDPMAEGFGRAQEKEDEARARAKEECLRLKPEFEQAAKWNAEDKVANPDTLRSLASADGVSVEIEPRANGEVVTVRGSEAEYPGAVGRVLFFMTSVGGATCMP
ncbi:DUF6199 family natural product biosynthesis protein [Nocardioides sp. NPDC059952]|uniref:DUF6199 family natural product biosynthesis protein n=1 Tax=Nocardioides sp. NPDC059952 TaxID=3347014 RepID=UPI003667F694